MIKKTKRIEISAFLGFLFLSLGFALTGSRIAAQQAGPYHLVKKVVLGGEGGWDYFDADSTTDRVFIPRNSHMMVTDPDGTIVGDMPNLPGAHGVVFAPEFKRGFTTNGDGRSVTIFDPGTLQVIQEVKIGDHEPDGILYDPGSKRVFTFNGLAHNTTAIDAKTGVVVGTVDLSAWPESAQADGEGHVFVNIPDKNQVLEFDSNLLKVITSWPVDPCKGPSGMAIDTANKRLFVGCGSKVMVMLDYTTGKVLDTVPIGNGVDADRFDPSTGFVFASTGDGTITVVHEDSPVKLSVVQTLKTQSGARTMGLDRKNHNIYTVTADSGPRPAATPENPRPRPTMVPNSFTLYIFSL